MIEYKHADVVGFYFLDLATGYEPPLDLVKFLEAGPPPIYIG
jgi:sterol 3beta-glucosyltransferase